VNDFAGFMGFIDVKGKRYSIYLRIVFNDESCEFTVWSWIGWFNILSSVTFYRGV
jgi:hypothetical protein